MSVDLLARCLRCKRMLPHADFPVVQTMWNSKTRKKRVVRDTYCNDCRPYVTPAQRRADVRDQRPPDR